MHAYTKLHGIRCLKPFEATVIIIIRNIIHYSNTLQHNSAVLKIAYHPVASALCDWWNMDPEVRHFLNGHA